MAPDKNSATLNPKKLRPKKPLSWVFKLFFLISALIIGSAAFRYFEDKHIIEQMHSYAENKAQMQEALGWGSELKIEKKKEPTTKIRFMLRDKKHNPIRGAVVNVTLSHADDRNGVLAQNALTLPLTMVEPGVYRGQINLPLPGDWDASITAEIGGNAYQISERVTLP